MCVRIYGNNYHHTLKSRKVMAEVVAVDVVEIVVMAQNYDTRENWEFHGLCVPTTYLPAYLRTCST